MLATFAPGKPQVLTSREIGRGSVGEGISNFANEERRDSNKRFSGAVLGFSCGKAGGLQRWTKTDTATTS